MSSLIEKVTGSFDDKRRWRDVNNRITALPAQYSTTVKAIERYCNYVAPISDGAIYVTMMDDLTQLFEQAAADGTAIRAVIGDDPVAFAEDFLSNYEQGQWIKKERKRLVDTIDSIAAETATGTGAK
jgi:DNA-binding ferritin-like protein (Dps family)